MPRKTLKSQGIRMSYGDRAKIPHVVKGCVPCPLKVTDEKGTRVVTVLATASRESAVKPFPTKRAATRAINNTVNFLGGNPADFNIQRVY